MRRAGLVAFAVAASGALLVSACGNESDDVRAVTGPSSDRPQVSPDPATLAGGCKILLGEDRVAERAFAVATHPWQEVDADLQDKLFAVVAAHNKRLESPAGQLVDFLDDPPAYVENGALSPRISGAVAEIRTACGK